jgi:hypothetical protein
MDGQAIAARPLGWGGLGALADRFPARPAERIRIDAALAILADEDVARATADGPASAMRDEFNRATRP